LPYYKYISFERFDGLRAGRIRFTQPSDFNDPFESLAFKVAEAERLRSLAEIASQLTVASAAQTATSFSGISGLPARRPPPSSYFPFWFEPPRKETPVPNDDALQRLRLIDKTFGILSLTAAKDNLLLWAHYAEQHRGIAVEIDTRDGAFTQGAHRAQDVEYTSVRPKIPESDEILFTHFFTKSLEWKYEKEYRIVRFLTDRVEVKAAKPYDIHLFDLPPSAIRGLIFGARVEPHRRDRLIRSLAADPAFAHLTFAQAVLTWDSFKMEFQDLPVLERRGQAAGLRIGG
jgi:hypothetical protein